MSQLGGYQMPTTGAIGGAKQLLNTSAKPQSVSASSQSAHAHDQGRASKKVKVSEQEAAAIAKRDAARARVQKRTMASFGLA